VKKLTEPHPSVTGRSVRHIERTLSALQHGTPLTRDQIAAAAARMRRGGGHRAPTRQVADLFQLASGSTR